MAKIRGERAIKPLKPGAGRLNDGGGLYLKPFAWGDTHAWRMDDAHEGRRRTLSLGAHPVVGLDEARALAKAARAKRAIGIDPVDERHEQCAQRRRSADDTRRAKSGQPVIGSFEEVARRWFAVNSSQWMETCSSKVIRRLELHAFPCFGAMPISESTPKTVLETCRAVERNDTLQTAHRLREHGSRVFRFAIAEGSDLRDPSHDIRDAPKRPVVRHFAAVTKPEPLAARRQAIGCSR